MTCLWLFGMDCSDVSWRSETHGKTTLAKSFRQLASLGVSKMYISQRHGSDQEHQKAHYIKEGPKHKAQPSQDHFCITLVWGLNSSTLHVSAKFHIEAKELKLGSCWEPKSSENIWVSKPWCPSVHPKKNMVIYGGFGPHPYHWTLRRIATRPPNDLSNMYSVHQFSSYFTTLATTQDNNNIEQHPLSPPHNVKKYWNGLLVVDCLSVSPLLAGRSDSNWTCRKKNTLPLTMYCMSSMGRQLRGFQIHILHPTLVLRAITCHNMP